MFVGSTYVLIPDYNTEPCVSAICETAKIVKMFCKRRHHVKIALRAFVLGALLSGAAVLCINWINGIGPFQNRILSLIHI